MNAYTYNQHGRYVATITCQPSPLDPSQHLLPKWATRTPPPETSAGQFARWTGERWLIADEPPAPTAPPPPPPPTAAEIRAAEIAGRLQQIDSEAARPLREIAAALATGEAAPAFALQKLQALEAEAASLRAERATL